MKHICGRIVLLLEMVISENAESKQIEHNLHRLRLHPVLHPQLLLHPHQVSSSSSQWRFCKGKINLWEKSPFCESNSTNNYLP